MPPIADTTACAAAAAVTNPYEQLGRHRASPHLMLGEQVTCIELLLTPCRNQSFHRTTQVF